MFIRGIRLKRVTFADSRNHDLKGKGMNGKGMKFFLTSATVQGFNRFDIAFGQRAQH
jgi:hypothetical protein